MPGMTVCRINGDDQGTVLLGGRTYGCRVGVQVLRAARHVVRLVVVSGCHDAHQLPSDVTVT